MEEGTDRAIYRIEHIATVGRNNDVVGVDSDIYLAFVALIELFEALHKGRGKHIAGSNLIIAIYLKHLLELRVFQANTLAPYVEVSSYIIVLERTEETLDRVYHDRVLKSLGRTCHKVISIESYSVGLVLLANRWAIGQR